MYYFCLCCSQPSAGGRRNLCVNKLVCGWPGWFRSQVESQIQFFQNQHKPSTSSTHTPWAKKCLMFSGVCDVAGAHLSSHHGERSPAAWGPGGAFDDDDEDDDKGLPKSCLFYFLLLHTAPSHNGKAALAVHIGKLAITVPPIKTCILH